MSLLLCVIDAFSHLKCGKSDGTNLISDHLAHALPALFRPIAWLFVHLYPEAWVHA